MVRLTIIVPVYNVEKYIAQCLESLVHQTLKNVEIICVNDGSSDRSGAICDDYAKKYSNVRVIHKENEGVTKARITGLKDATSDYVAFVDSDDWIEPELYSKLLEKMMNYKCDFVSSGYLCDMENTVSHEYNTIPEGIYNTQEDGYKFYQTMIYNGKAFNHGILRSCCAKIFRKDLLLEQISKVSPVIKYGEDAVTVYSYLLKCKKVYIFHYAGYHYRQRANSAIGKQYSDYFMQVQEIYTCIKREICNHPAKEYLVNQMNQYISELLLYGINYLSDIKQTIHIPYYNFPDNLLIKNKRILLYGAGKVGQAFYQQFRTDKLCSIVGWVDKNPDRYKNILAEVKGLDQINQISFDLLIIALRYQEIAMIIKQELIQNGINPDKIIWKQPVDFFEYYSCIK